jgi:hypothetical protein
MTTMSPENPEPVDRDGETSIKDLRCHSLALTQ